jgi:hypothetical protein
MSNKPRLIGNVMAGYRDQAKDEAVAGLKALEVILDLENPRPMTETERLRREARAYRSLQVVIKCMVGQGAKIRPD